jgi:hypothetical protein
MRLSQPKLPLSAIYLNLLQTRPVSPVPPVARLASGPAATAPASAAPAAGRPISRDLPRGSLVDILA